MKMFRLRGRVVEIECQVLIVTDRKGNETFRLPQSSLPELQPGDPVDCLVIPPLHGNGLCRVMSSKSCSEKKPKKLREFSTMLRAMQKVRAMLIARQNVLERDENPDPDELEKLFEKLDFLDRGIKLFVE